MKFAIRNENTIQVAFAAVPVKVSDKFMIEHELTIIFKGLRDEYIEDDIKCAKITADIKGFQYWNDKFEKYCKGKSANLPNLQALRCKLEDVQVRPPIRSKAYIFKKFEQRRMNIRDREGYFPNNFNQ